MLESSDKMWSTGEGNGKPLQYSCLENPMNNMKRQKDEKLKDELPRLGRSPGGGNGNPLQYYSLENSTDREAW